jgi:hypothetical protein
MEMGRKIIEEVCGGQVEIVGFRFPDSEFKFI